MTFYLQKVKYQIDETSPSKNAMDIVDPEPHEILSKRL